jgi:hypothetical protein
LHGQVSLEVFGHHRWLFPDGCETLYRAEVEVILSDLLLDPERRSVDRPVVPPPQDPRASAQ